MLPKQKKRGGIRVRVTLLSLGSRLYSAAIKHAEFAKPNGCFNLCPTPLRACVPLVFSDSSGNQDRFYVTPRVQFPSSYQFHYCRVTFSSHLNSKVGKILVKSSGLRINLNIDDTPIGSRSHSSLTLKPVSS
jgi:hypothetical protein